MDVDLDDAVSQLQDEILERARQEGRRSGEAQAAAEAKESGLMKGKEFGVEFGFYCGSVRALKNLLSQPLLLKSTQMSASELPEDSKRRHEVLMICERLDKPGVAKVLDELETMIVDFPVGSPFDDDTHKKFLKIRAKFKVLEARIGVVLDIQPSLDQKITTVNHGNETLSF